MGRRFRKAKMGNMQKTPSKRWSENERKRCFRSSKKRDSAKGSKMESLKYSQDLPTNHIKVLRKAAWRKWPKTCLPARVQREGPKRPKSENSSISLYCQQKYNKNTRKRNLPGSSQEAPGGTLWRQKGVREGTPCFDTQIGRCFVLFHETLNISLYQWTNIKF